MSKPTKATFKAKVGEKEITLAVLSPSAGIKERGRYIHASAYNKAVTEGAMIREELENHLRKARLWDDERQAEHERLRTVILDGERRLAKGGMRLKEAKAVALEMAKARMEMQALLSQRSRMDLNTADAIADQAQFNFFVACCTVYNDTGKPFFTTDGEKPSLDTYIERGGEPVAIDAATHMNEMMFGSTKDIMAKLPENLFLKRFNFVDQDLHLINERGQRVDQDGRLVDAEGRFVDQDGKYVDADGHPVDKEGRYVADEQPFLDDDGKPIQPPHDPPAPTAAEPPAPEPVKATPEAKPEGPKKKSPLELMAAAN